MFNCVFVLLIRNEEYNYWPSFWNYIELTYPEISPKYAHIGLRFFLRFLPISISFPCNNCLLC